jgi:hypothetical protein
MLRRASVHKAVEKAWATVPDEDKRREHEVTIYVRGTNPITGYRVELQPR